MVPFHGYGTFFIFRGIKSPKHRMGLSRNLMHIICFINRDGIVLLVRFPIQDRVDRNYRLTCAQGKKYKYEFIIGCKDRTIRKQISMLFVNTSSTLLVVCG